MNLDPKDSNNQPPSYFQSMWSQVQRGQSALSSLYQSGQGALSSMQQNFSQNFPQLSSSVNSVSDSVSQMANQGRSKASEQIDSSMQQLGVSATNKGRDWIKFQPDPNEFFVTRYQKKAFNFGVDLVADNMVRIANAAKGFSSGVAEKMPEGTLDRLNPMHLGTLASNPELVKRYMSQRKSQILQPIDLFNDPSSFARKKLDQAKNGFWNMSDHVSSLEGGFSGKVFHGGRAFVDFTQDKIAPAIGVGLGMYGLYNLPQKHRQRTNQAMDSMFPKKTMYGKAARFPPTKFMLTKPLARIRGNPWLSLGVLGYTVATSIGKSISDSQKLVKSDPKTFQRLQANGNEMYRSSLHLDMRNAINRTRRNSL